MADSHFRHDAPFARVRGRGVGSEGWRYCLHKLRGPPLYVKLLPRYAGDDADPRGFFLAPSRPPGFLKR